MVVGTTVVGTAIVGTAVCTRSTTEKAVGLLWVKTERNKQILAVRGTHTQHINSSTIHYVA